MPALPSSVSPSLGRGLRAAVVALLSYPVAFGFTSLIHPESAQFGAMWAAVSGLAVSQDDPISGRDGAILRLGGTLIGAAIAAATLSLFPFSAVGLGLAVGLAMALGSLFRLSDGGRLAAITVTVIMILSVINPGLSPLGNALLRTLEAGVGAGIALAVAWVWVLLTRR